MFNYSILPSTWYCILLQRVRLFHITIHMILHSVCTTCSLIPYYHPHDIAFCYNVFTYSLLPSTWYCILFVQHVHLFHITIHMILHSVCTTCSWYCILLFLIPYYHPHDIAFCLYNVFTYSILPSTWYCILCVQRVHLFHITIHMIVHSVCTCSLIPYYHSHDSAFCLYNVLAYSTLPSTWYCILFVQRVHFHITIHIILHSVCTTCSLIPYYHPHDSVFCLCDVFAYSILPSTWYCILFVQRVHLFHITIHMIVYSVCATCSLIPYYHPHDIAFCLYNMFTYSILPTTRYCILCVQCVRLFHITIHMIVNSVCTMCSLIPYYHPHGIAFCLYNVFTSSILPSTWYCILLQRVHLFHITIRMILHSVCTRCSLSPHYHPHDIAFCLYAFTYSILPSTWYCILFVRGHLFHIKIHTILHSVYNVFTYTILPSTWYCILCVQRVHLFHITIHMIVHSVCTTCSLIPYYHPHDSAFCLYNVFAYSILPSPWYCILFVQHVHLFHITIHMILHSVTTCSLIPYYHPHDIAFCLYNMFTYSILPSTWYCILFVQRVHLFHITIHMILHSVCTTCSLIPYYHPHDSVFCLCDVFAYSILPSTWYCILFVQHVHLFHITIHMILHSVCTTCSLIPYYHPHDMYSVCTMCSLIPYYHPHDIAFCLYNVFTYSILPSTWYCILLQRVHLFLITIHTILHSVCTTCSLIPYYHPHDIAFCLYNAFNYSILPSTWYCILLQRVRLFHITIHMILHSVCTTCSLIPYYHPHDIAFCYNVFTYSLLPSTQYCILFVQGVHLSTLPSTWYCILFVFTYSILPSTWYCILLYNVFTYSILPSTWYCILCVQRVHLFHITIHMILHSVCTTCSLIPYYHPHDSAFCVYNVFAYSILPSTWYCILCTTCSLPYYRPHDIAFCLCSLIPYYHPHGIAFCLYNVFTYSILPSTRYCILFVQRVHFHITIHMILHSVTTCSLIPYYHPHDIAFCLYKVFT